VVNPEDGEKTTAARKLLTPWEQITPEWSRRDLIEGAGNRLKRIMYFPDVGAVPDDAFTRHCREADQRLDALRLADPDDAGMAYAGLSFTAVASGASPEERARVEYYLCHELIEYMERHGGWYPDHPALDPAWRGLYPEEEAGPAPQTPLEAAVIARAAESAALDAGRLTAGQCEDCSCCTARGCRNGPGGPIGRRCPSNSLGESGCPCTGD